MKKIIVLGSGAFAGKIAEISSGYLDTTVYEYSINDVSVLRDRCVTLGLPYEHVDKKRLTDILCSITEETLVVSASNTFLFPKEVLANEKLKVINWHNAMLPFHKGRNAEAWEIFEGDDKAGVTWHIVDADVDHGEILMQEHIEIAEDETALSLIRKEMERGEEMFKLLLPKLLNKTAKMTEMSHEEGTLHYSKDVPNGGELDLSWSGEKMSRFLRAMNYGPLKLMGEPWVLYEGVKYKWKRYSIEAGDCENSIAFSENCVIKKDGLQITLKKLEPFKE